MSAGNDNLPIGPKDITDIFKLASELFAVINEGPTTIPWNQKAAHWWSNNANKFPKFSGSVSTMVRTLSANSEGTLPSHVDQWFGILRGGSFDRHNELFDSAVQNITYHIIEVLAFALYINSIYPDMAPANLPIPQNDTYEN